jgi:protoporphyrinogen/coproporphyrinogen III oxidase
MDLFSSDGMFLPVVWHMLRNYWTVHRKPADGPSDESLANFMSRLGGEYIVDNFLSAMIHGIWAGNVNELSMHSFNSKISNRLWKMYEAGELSIAQVQRMLDVRSSRPEMPLHQKYWVSWAIADQDVHEAVRSRIGLSSAFYMKDGLAQVVKSLETTLRFLPTVDIKTDAKIISLAPNNGGVVVSHIFKLFR